MRFSLYAWLLPLVLLLAATPGCHCVLGIDGLTEETGGEGASTADGGGGTTTSPDGGGGTTTTSPDGGGGTTTTTTTTSPPCMMDGIQNGDETDLDCGGSLCPACDLGQKCIAGMDCQSGFCVDDLCCDTACNGQCESCNQSGAQGTCTLIPAREDLDTECSPGTMACDGQGACKLLDAQPCSAGVECISGECVDGLCCDKPCGELCESCNQPGHEGICRSIPAGTDPVDECMGTDVCNGLGQCVAAGSTSANGATCQSGMEAACASMVCADDVCCEKQCDYEKCLGCSKTLTGLTDGKCAAVVPGTDPKDECVDPLICIGNGVCGPPP